MAELQGDTEVMFVLSSLATDHIPAREADAQLGVGSQQTLRPAQSQSLHGGGH